MKDMIKIYEEIIDEKPFDINNFSSWIIDELNANSIEFETEIIEKIDEENGDIEEYVAFLIEKNNLDKVKKFINTELLMLDKIDISKEEHEELNEFSLNESDNENDIMTEEEINEIGLKLSKKMKRLKRFLLIGEIFIVVSVLIIVFSFVALDLEWGKEIIKSYDTLMIIAACLGGISFILLMIDVFLYGKYDNEYKKKVIGMITRNLIKPFKLSYSGIDKEFFAKHNIAKQYNYNIFSSRDGVVGERNGSKFLFSRIVLESKMFMEKYPRLVFEGVFVKSQNSNSFDKVIKIKSKSDSYYAEEEDKVVDNAEEFSKLSNEEIYKLFSRENDIIIDDVVVKPEEINFEFVKEIVRINQLECWYPSYEFFKDVFCIMVDAMSVLADEYDLKGIDVLQYERDEKIRKVLMEDIDLVMKYIEIGNLFKFNK